MANGNILIGCYIVSLVYLCGWLGLRCFPKYYIEGCDPQPCYFPFNIAKSLDDINIALDYFGYILLNIWTFFWYVILLFALQFASGDGFVDKHLIFMLQQSFLANVVVSSVWI